MWLNLGMKKNLAARDARILQRTLADTKAKTVDETDANWTQRHSSKSRVTE